MGRKWRRQIHIDWKKGNKRNPCDTKRCTTENSYSKHLQSILFWKKRLHCKDQSSDKQGKRKVRLNFLSPGEYEFDDISLITVPKKMFLPD